jgi:hypothetical protein
MARRPPPLHAMQPAHRPLRHNMLTFTTLRSGAPTWRPQPVASPLRSPRRSFRLLSRELRARFSPAPLGLPAGVPLHRARRKGFAAEYGLAVRVGDEADALPDSVNRGGGFTPTDLVSVTATLLARARSFGACRSWPRLPPHRGRALQRHRAHRLATRTTPRGAVDAASTDGALDYGLRRIDNVVSSERPPS